MEFLQHNLAIILVAAVTILLIAVFSFISKRRRQKQEDEMNNISSYSTISKTKKPEIKPQEMPHYKFSLETGEEINKSAEVNIFSNLSSISEEDTIQKIEERFNSQNLSETQKKEIIEKVKAALAKKPEVKQDDLDLKIKAIEKSNLSEAQKNKMIAFLKKNEI